MRMPLFYAALAAVLWGQAPVAAQDNYRKTHDALFATFLPVEEMKDDAQVSRLLQAADDGIWAAAGQSPQFRQFLAPFTNLASFGPACGMDALFGDAHTAAYVGMTAAQRRRAIELLQRCSETSRAASPPASATSMS